MLTLFPDEKVVMQSNDKSATLTTHRICYESKEWGKAYNQNIMLEHVTSTENMYTQNSLFLIIGCILLVGGVLISEMNSFNRGATTGSIILGLLLILIYFLTRRNTIIIGSPSTKMKINVNGMHRDKVLDFINTIEQTINNRSKEIKQ